MILDQEKVNNAILTINPDAECVWDTSDTADIQWLNGTSPISDADLKTKITELDTEYASQEYARNRAKEYAKLNQFEMQFDDQRDSTTTWVDAVNAIKVKHPKP